MYNKTKFAAAVLIIAATIAIAGVWEPRELAEVYMAAGLVGIFGMIVIIALVLTSNPRH